MNLHVGQQQQQQQQQQQHEAPNNPRPFGDVRIHRALYNRRARARADKRQAAEGRRCNPACGGLQQKQHTIQKNNTEFRDARTSGDRWSRRRRLRSS